MNIHKITKLAKTWQKLDALDFHAEWPRSIPKKLRTIAYMDKCKAAAADLDRHTRKNFARALKALKEEHAEVVCLDEMHGGVHIKSECSVCKLINELEEVK